MIDDYLSLPELWKIIECLKGDIYSEGYRNKIEELYVEKIWEEVEENGGKAKNGSKN